jgi:hypothetical protein
MALKKSMCSMSIGKIVVVQMAGEYGSRIEDDTRTDIISRNEQDRQDSSVTLFEDTTYRIHFQFDCNEERARFPSENACELSQNVKVWIDFNDNGFYDAQNLVPRRSQSNIYIPGDSYDLDIYIPTIDDRNTKAGIHRMRFTVVPTEDYYRSCGLVQFDETREYAVNILTKAKYSGKSNLFTDF